MNVMDPILDEPPEPVGRAVVIRESVHVSGRLDSTNLDVLAAALSKAARRTPHGFTVDLTAATHLAGEAAAVLRRFAAHEPRLLARRGSAVERAVRSAELHHWLQVAPPARAPRASAP